MQIAFGRVRRKTSPVRKYVRDCYSLKCQHIFGLYYNLKVDKALEEEKWNSQQKLCLFFFQSWS